VDDFLSAAVPEPFQILGTELRPYALGHHLILERFENGFLSGNGSVDDLIFGVIVCSQTYDEALTFMRAPDRDEQAAAWAEKVKAQLASEGQGLDIVDKAELFQVYLDDGRRIPVYSYEDGKGSSVGAPWWQILKVTLLAELGLSESAVLNRPLRLSWLDYLSWREINGKGVKLVPDVERLDEAQAEADAFHERMMAQRLTPEALVQSVKGVRNGS
jgi:hypothetical protein